MTTQPAGTGNAAQLSVLVDGRTIVHVFGKEPGQESDPARLGATPGLGGGKGGMRWSSGSGRFERANLTATTAVTPSLLCGPKVNGPPRRSVTPLFNRSHPSGRGLRRGTTRRRAGQFALDES